MKNLTPKTTTPKSSGVANPSKTFLGQAGLLAAGLALSACSGGGSSGSGSSGFALTAVSVQPNATVQINRPIEFTFTQAVDFASVNLNTISITQVGGGPAAGEFRLKTKKSDPLDPCSADVLVPNVVIFQPSCPTLDDFSDSGLTPGGVQYQINVVGSTTGGSTVRSNSGKNLGESQTLNFVTPASTQASTLFVDPVVNSAPRAIILDPNCTNQTKLSYLELGGDTQNRELFVKRATPVAALGADVETTGFLAPLNFYSDGASKVAIIVQLDQPVNPSTTNVSDATVLLQYLANEALPNVDASWAPVPHTVSLDANCTVSGAVLRIVPIGILPQGRLVRVVLTPDFRDLVGNGNILPAVVGSFRVRTASTPTLTPADTTADGATETFTVGGTTTGSNQDTTAVLDAAPAAWGEDGQLKASFNFGGTGGPGGAFVYRVRSISNGTTVFNTTFQSITNEDQSLTEPCVNGQVDVKDFIVDAGGVLEIRGPNPCVIRASGKVDIQGRIFLRGTNSRGVVSYSSANLPEAGGSGAAGGGRGGTGSYLTTQSTPRGESGYGAFNVANGGGEGGETGFNASSDVNARRGAGGGGGNFATDVPRLATSTTLNPACPEQTIIGLDAEDGSNGSPSASGAQHPVGQVPQGGKKGPRPFVDNNPTDLTIAALDDDAGTPTQTKFHLNDFWGSMLVGTTVIAGELANPYAGAGGGGGGNACGTATFPTTPFSAINDKKGAGGGGGGGSLTILCLGNITFGAAGRIDASGGTGGGGENTNGTNRIGGGSGGGSGGHVILQAGGNIDFRSCVPGTAAANYSTGAGIFARGGEGGEGADGIGGTNPPSIENPPTSDMLPPNSYNGGACAFTGNAVGTIVGCGGDGGPGVIQLHVSDLSKILVPTAATTKISNIVRPNPIGTTPLNTDTPASWRQLLPIFGRNSKAVSKWIPLGSTSVPATGSTPKPITFVFGGTNPATGFVSSAAGQVSELPPILTGTLAAEPALPFITADKRSVVFDATTIAGADDIYLRNPGLVSQFGLRIVGVTTQRFDIATATYDENAQTLRVTVVDSGTPLNNLTGVASIIPRFFRVLQDGTLDSLTTSSTVKIEFQAAPAAASGLPNATLATPWVTDINLLNTSVSPANTTLRFFRFRVAFEIGVGSSNLDFNTPIPSLDFLKVPFKF